MWNIINRKLYRKTKRNKTRIKKIKNNNGELITETNEISKIFNDFFVNIGNKLASKIKSVPLQIHSNPVHNSIQLFDTDVDEVKKLIKSLSSKKCTRSNDVPTKFLKISLDVISPFLADFFNICMKTGIYPDSLKIAQVIPIYKNKGPKDDCSSYRPISILSQINKIFEKLIKNRLMAFLEKHKVLSNHQFGFRKNNSTAFAVYDLVEHLMKNKDNDEYTCTFFLDLSKAFDTVNREILNQKLWRYGIRGPAFDLIKSYLTNRKQYTLVNGVHSQELAIEIGVPQGSVLGPLLFLLYINDLPLASKIIIKMSADDTCLVFSAASLDELQIKINREINKIDNWMTSNKLTLNYSKTRFMLTHRKKEKPLLNLYINNNKIEQVSTFEYLGITIDENLNWGEHIKTVESKLSQACGAIARLRHHVDLRCLRAMYFGHAYSHLQYSILAWSSIPKTRLKRLNVLHNRLIRLMTLHGSLDGLNFTNVELFKSAGLLNFEEICELELAKFMHRAVNNTLPSTIIDHFKRPNSRHRLRSTSANPFIVNYTKTTAYRKWITNAGIDLWNEINPDLRSLPYPLFKSKYKKYLLDSVNTT